MVQVIERSTVIFEQQAEHCTEYKRINAKFPYRSELLGVLLLTGYLHLPYSLNVTILNKYP